MGCFLLVGCTKKEEAATGTTSVPQMESAAPDATTTTVAPAQGLPAPRQQVTKAGTTKKHSAHRRHKRKRHHR